MENTSSLEPVTCLFDPNSDPEKFRHWYNQLRKRARERLSREQNVSLQATELVDEALTYIYKHNNNQWPTFASEGDFFRVVFWKLQRIVIDHVRSKSARPKTENSRKLSRPIEDIAAEVQSLSNYEDIVAVAEMLDWLDSVSGKTKDISFALRSYFFAGLTFAEIGVVLNCTEDHARKIVNDGLRMLRARM